MVNVQTGPASGLGKGMRQGAEAVFKAINGKGGVNGRQITCWSATTATSRTRPSTRR